jgi:flagellar motility protein MotE (MotC chaperone)
MSAEMEESELSAFQRFLYWFLVPVTFVVVLITVLMTLFGYDTKASALKLAHKIPLVGSYIPDPSAKPAAAETKTDPEAEEDKAVKQTANTAALNEKIRLQVEDLKKADALFVQKDQQLKELQAKNTQMEEQLKTKTQSDEEYRVKIKQMSSVYAKMTPNKAAPILQNMTNMERVLLLSEMKPEEQSRILEKMDPKMAADTSMQLKDQIPAKDREIAALQERVKAAEDKASKGGQKLTGSDIGQTFSTMAPKNAATLLLEMYAANPNKVLDILSSTATPARSSIMGAMADLDKVKTAVISNRLAP